MNVADMLLYIYQNEIHPPKEFAINLKSASDTYQKLELFDFLMQQLGMDLHDNMNYELCKSYFLDNIHKEKINKYAENPYVKLFKNINIQEKGYSLTTLSYEPYQLFPLDDLQVEDKNNFKENTPIGFFDNRYEYLALLQNNRIWMSLNPNEINTMEPHIKLATGDVLVLGLGLGYFAFMCAIKSECKSITIIEKDQEIISLFDKHLLKHFINKEKITIIKSDAIEYIRLHHNYDYIFADLWHDPVDGANLYYSLLLQEKEHALNISYWIEKSLLAMVRRISLTIIDALLLNKKLSKTFFAKYKFAQKLYDSYANINLKESKLETLLTDSYLKSILLK